MAEQWRRGTRDLGVWGSIPEALVRCNSLGQTLNPHYLWPPSSNGYLVHRFKVRSIVAVALSSPGEKIKSDEYCIEIWTLNKYLYLYLYTGYMSESSLTRGGHNTCTYTETYMTQICWQYSLLNLICTNHIYLCSKSNSELHFLTYRDPYVGRFAGCTFEAV